MSGQQGGPVEDSEVWKWIPGYESLYEVSSFGRIRTVAAFTKLGSIYKKNHPVMRRQAHDHNGYCRVTLSDRGRKTTVSVHRLVLTSFIGLCPDGMECGHRDGCRTNNRVDNLRWVTKLENMADRDRHGNTKRCGTSIKPYHLSGEDNNLSVLTEAAVVEVRRLASLKHEPVASMAKRLNVSQNTIYNIIKRATWKHLP